MVLFTSQSGQGAIKFANLGADDWTFWPNSGSISSNQVSSLIGMLHFCHQALCNVKEGPSILWNGRQLMVGGVTY